MARYRVTIRYGRPRSQYEVLDLDAETLAGALRAAAGALPQEVNAAADLAEIRLLVGEDEREYTPG